MRVYILEYATANPSGNTIRPTSGYPLDNKQAAVMAAAAWPEGNDDVMGIRKP